MDTDNGKAPLGDSPRSSDPRGDTDPLGPAFAMAENDDELTDPIIPRAAWTSVANRLRVPLIALNN